jgi:hypothetical protein
VVRRKDHRWRVLAIVDEAAVVRGGEADGGR